MRTFYVSIHKSVLDNDTTHLLAVEEVGAERVEIEAGGTLVFSNFGDRDRDNTIVVAYAPGTWTHFSEYEDK